MQTGHELFVHELKDMLDGERQLVEALQELESDSTNPQLKKAFEMHRKETEGHAERLQKCFELLGEQAAAGECAGIKGLVEEKKIFMKEDPSKDILDTFHVGAAIKTENYEINAYEAIIDMARAMKHTKVAQLLGQNLKQERAALKKMEVFKKKIKPEQMMTEEQEEMSNQRRRGPSSSRSSRRRAA
jgi:ferritin-like metal-binding protein YciE